MAANRSPSSTMPGASTLTTSALIGPSTIVQISLMTDWSERPDLATSEGFVVTPSTMPHD
jgi:hypothetical protein